MGNRYDVDPAPELSVIEPVIIEDGRVSHDEVRPVPSKELVLWQGVRGRPGNEDVADVVELPAVRGSTCVCHRKLGSRRRAVATALVVGLLVGGATGYLISKGNAAAGALVTTVDRMSSSTRSRCMRVRDDHRGAVSAKAQRILLGPSAPEQS
jgi:hypothetical protein